MDNKIKVMVNGLPGKMASEVAMAVEKAEDMALVRYSLTGAGMPPYLPLENPLRWTEMKLIGPHEREILGEGPDFISVDYTQPDAVNSNADFYCRHKLPFIMGTTGGDRKTLEQRVKDSQICAVIAPNMAKPIVAFQAMMKYAAENFPDCFKGYSLEIVESHQKGKKDTSGTAKAMVQYFNSMGIPFTENQINMIRDSEKQKEIGVPAEYLGGHGWHTYTLKSDDGNVLFRFTHNVNGRSVYANGTLDAIRFLDKKVKAGEKEKVYSMIDVLKG